MPAPKPETFADAAFRLTALTSGLLAGALADPRIALGAKGNPRSGFRHVLRTKTTRLVHRSEVTCREQHRAVAVGENREHSWPFAYAG